MNQQHNTLQRHFRPLIAVAAALTLAISAVPPAHAVTTISIDVREYSCHNPRNSPEFRMDCLKVRKSCAEAPAPHRCVLILALPGCDKATAALNKAKEACEKRLCLPKERRAYEAAKENQKIQCNV